MKQEQFVWRIVYHTGAIPEFVVAPTIVAAAALIPPKLVGGVNRIEYVGGVLS